MTEQMKPAGEYAKLAEDHVDASRRAGIGHENATRHVARAQVYATLALAAATQEATHG